MADETVRIIRIETGGSEQTVKGLKDEINSLRDALLNTEKGTDEYKQVLEQLIADQQKLAEVMNAGKSQVSAATGSYNALVNQMTALKKVWRETTDEASRKEIGNQIKDLNDKLKGMDESIGDYRRNVGNYANAISASFSQMGGAAKGMVGPLGSVKAGLTAISSHPIVAVITVLAGLLINGIAKGFKSSEENTNKLKVAFSGFKAIGDAVLKLFQGLAGWIAKVAEAAVNFADKLGLITPKMKERMELTKKQIALEKQERDNIVKNAQLETDAAELRAKASDEENYSISQRIKFLQEAQAKEEEQLNLEKQILEQKVAQLEAQLALTDSTGEELTKLNELKAQVIKVNGQIAQAQRKSLKEINALRKQGIQQATQARQQMLSLQKDLIQQEYDLAEDGSKEQLDLAKELRKKELEIQQEGFKTKIKNRNDYEKAMKLSMDAYNADIQKLEKEHARKEAQVRSEEYEYELTRGLREGSSKYYAALAEVRQKELNRIKKDNDKYEGETDKQFEKRLDGYRNEIKQLYDLGLQASEKEKEITNQIYLNGVRPLSKYYEEQMWLLIDMYTKMEPLKLESLDEYNARLNAKWKEAMDSFTNWRTALLNEQQLSWNLQDAVMYKGFTRQNEELIKNQERQKKIWDDQLQTIGLYILENTHEWADKIHVPIGQIIDGIAQDWETGGSENILKTFNMFVEKGLIPDEIIQSHIEALRGMADAERAILEYRYQNWNDLTTSIVGLTESVADAYEADLKYAVEHNQKSEEVAKKEFETVKALRISAAIVDTIQGAIAAFMGWQDKGQPWGAIIGATQAAATLAAGWAQIRQIQSTKFGATGSGGGSTMMAQAQVIPTMMDYNPQMTGNLTGQQETEELANAITSKPIRAYVVESDITSAQQLTAQRQAESTF